MEGKGGAFELVPCHRVGTVANQAYVFAVSPPSPLLRRGPGRGRSSPRPTVRINGLSVRSEQEGEGVQREGLDIMSGCYIYVILRRTKLSPKLSAPPCQTNLTGLADKGRT